MAFLVGRRRQNASHIGKITREADVFPRGAGLRGRRAAPRDLITTFRNTTIVIQISDPVTFSGTTFRYLNDFFLNDNGGVPGTEDSTFNILPGSSNVEFSASGAVTVAPDGLVPATPSPIPYTLTHDGSGPGAWRLDYDGVATDVPGRTFLTTSIIGGRFALTFAGGGSGAIDPGGLFRTSVVIDGDWADPANRTGATFNAGYTLTSDFIVSGSTLVSVETLNWDGVNPGLSFTLFGGMAPSPVPVPGALGLLLAGLAGLAATRRRG